MKNRDTSNSYVVNYGNCWDLNEELFSIGECFVKKLFDNGFINGITYVECSSSEFGIELFNNAKELDDNIEFNIYEVNTPELEMLKKRYLRMIDNIEKLENYDNIVYVVDDYPYYSHSDRNFYTSNILIVNKNSSIFIDLVYKKNKYEISDCELSNICKRLILK